MSGNWFLLYGMQCAAGSMKSVGLEEAGFSLDLQHPFLKEHQTGPRHSGAGRIGRIRMHPMSSAESGDSVCMVSLKGLFEGIFAPGMLMEDSKDAAALVGLACRGGWPEAIEMTPDAAQRISREYLRVLFQESATKSGLHSDIASRLLTSIARTVGQSASQKTLYRDMTGEDITQLTSSQKALLLRYISFFKSIYLIEEIPSWVPPARSPKRLSVKPKRYLADPSLAIAQLSMGIDSLLRDWQTFGTIFENLCMRDLLVYASSLPNIGLQPVRYYRDDSGLEVDAIIELTDGDGLPSRSRRAKTRWMKVSRISSECAPKSVKTQRRKRGRQSSWRL